MQKLGPNQKKWLEALESGKYKQGKDYLRTINDEFCCLGVACDVFGLESIMDYEFYSDLQKEDGVYYLYTKEVNGRKSWDSATLPYYLVEKLGLYSNNGQNNECGHECLTNLNDKGVPFKEIAAKIRAKPENWFREPK